MRFHIVLSDLPPAMAMQCSMTPRAGNVVACCAQKSFYWGAGEGSSLETAQRTAQAVVDARRLPGLNSVVLVAEGDPCLGELLARIG